MHLYLPRIFFIVPCLIFLFGTGPASSADTPNNQQEQSLTQENTEEVITISGVLYPVPAPWKGNKVDAPKLTYSDFKQIPLKFCKDEGKVYVTIETQKNLVKMLTQAEEDGLLILVESGYRSANYQTKIFKRMLSEGRDFEDIIRYVAPPGYSNHMLGTAVDFSPSNWRFADTKQYLWLQENGHTFGFEEIYSETNSLKMPWEAWHWQYMESAEPVNTLTTN